MKVIFLLTARFTALSGRLFPPKSNRIIQENLKLAVIDLFRSNNVLRLTALSTFWKDSLLERYVTLSFNWSIGAEYDLTLKN